MNKVSIVVIVVLALIILAGGYFYYTLLQDKNALAAELVSTQNELAATRAELDNTASQLSFTQETLSATQATLEQTKTELSDTNNTLSETRTTLSTTSQTLTLKIGELDTANKQIISVQKSYDDLKTSSIETLEQLTIAQETLDGLGITLSKTAQCYDARLVDNVTAVNPTFKELKAFLSSDLTEKHAYVLHEYDCSEFSRDVHNNAEAAGIRAAVMHINFENEIMGHALNAFMTTDFGLVYVDCTDSPDKIAYSKKGKQFRAIDATWIIGINVRSDRWWDAQSTYYYMATSSGSHAVVETMTIYW